MKLSRRYNNYNLLLLKQIIINNNILINLFILTRLIYLFLT